MPGGLGLGQTLTVLGKSALWLHRVEDIVWYNLSLCYSCSGYLCSDNSSLAHWERQDAFAPCLVALWQMQGSCNVFCQGSGSLLLQITHFPLTRTIQPQCLLLDSAVWGENFGQFHALRWDSRYSVISWEKWHLWELDFSLLHPHQPINLQGTENNFCSSKENNLYLAPL